MLTDALQQLVREAGGDALLLDARKGRGIVTDTTNLADICRRLANAGFTRLIDFSAKHEGGEDYTLYLTLRHPAAGHAALTLKWKFSAAIETADHFAEKPKEGNGEPPAPTYNVNGGAGQPGGTPRRAGTAAHPTLSRVWRAAALCEREMFELLGIPFAGNENLDPLYLEDSFAGHPLRRDFALHPAPAYASELLRTRHEAALIDAPVPDEGGTP